MKTFTLKDVAKKAGVGIGTASRVLNNQAHVSDEKRQKVLDAIKELNYQPDEIARSLKTKSTKNIGVILNDITNPFYADLLRGLETEAVEANYSIIFIDLFLQKGQWVETVLNLYKSKVDGIIYIGSSVNDEMAKTCLDMDIPSVYASTSIDVNEVDRSKIYSVDIDNEAAAYHVTMKLIEYGHTDIGLVLGNEDDLNSTLHRKIGIERAIEEQGLTLKPEWQYYGDFSFESGYSAMKKILKQEKLPTAVFVISDLMAIGASKAIMESGRKIPDDISVFGFDGIKNSKYFHPEISTVDQPRYEMGCKAARKLIDLINQVPDVEPSTILSYELIIRESITKR